MFVRKSTYKDVLGQLQDLAVSTDIIASQRNKLLEETMWLNQDRKSLKLLVKALLKLRGKKPIPVDVIKLLRKHGL